MSTRFRFVAAAAVALAVLCVPSVSAFRQDLTLRYRWTKGETLRYRIVQQSATTMSGLPGGMPEMTINQSTIQIFRAVAEDVLADGTTTIREAVESVQMEMASPMGTMKYDSTTPDAVSDPMSANLKTIFSAIIGESFTLVVAPTGEVQKVEGLSKFAEKMFKDLPQDPMTAGVIQGLKGNFSDEGMRNTFTQAFAQFPGHPLKPGDTWKGEITNVNFMLGNMTTMVTSTLKAVEGQGSNRLATIATSLTLKQDPTKPAAPNPMGMTMQMGDSTGEGEQIFEAVTGRLRRSTTHVTMPLTMTGTTPDGAPMSLNTVVKATTTVELVQ